MIAVKELNLHFNTQRGPLHILKNISFSVKRGDSIGLVGESGSGKSVLSLTLMNLLSENAVISSGSILRDPNVKVGMIFQDPQGSLNPVLTLEQQLDDVLLNDGVFDQQKRKKIKLESLAMVGIPEPEQRLKAYSFQLSGGLAQRFMIALTMCRNPDILIADEPTTALDVTIQAQILSLLRKLQREGSLGLLLISHDLAVIAQNTKQTAVMYAGEIVETGSTSELIAQPRHPYTKALLQSLPARHIPQNQENIAGGSEDLPTIRGTIPDLLVRPQGCSFYERCDFHQAACKQEQKDVTMLHRSWKCCLA